MVGIPTNYVYDRTIDIERQDIKIRGKDINWNTPEGKILEEALVMNDEEQIFGIAREIFQLQTSKVLLNALYPCTTLLMVYTIGNQLNQRLNFYARPASVRSIPFNDKNYNLNS